MTMLSKTFGILSFSILPFIFSVFDSEFVFDDAEAIVKNKDVYGDSWIEPFHNDFWGTIIKSNLSHKSYRPLTILSFRLNYLLSKNSLVASHFKLTNLICHTTCCILFWLCSKKLLKRKSKEWWNDTPYLAALLFSVHPVHVESVSGIVGRADMLAALTFFTAFLIYSRAVSSSLVKQMMCLVLTVILSCISMLFKENGITVLGLCMIYEILNSVTVKTDSEKGKLKIKLPRGSMFRITFVLTAALCILYGRWRVMGGVSPQFKSIDNPAAFANSSFTKISTYNYIYFLNLLLLIWPQWLCYDWSMGCVPLVDKLSDTRIVCIILIYSYGILILRSLMKHTSKGCTKRDLVLSIALLSVPFLPAANILYPVGFVIAERILYIPSAGYCLLIVLGYEKIVQRKRFRKYGITLFMLLLITYILKSSHRSQEWQNEYKLFTSGLTVCPLNAKIHYNVAKVADARHNTEWALREYREAIRLNPEYYQAMNNLANLLKNYKQYSEAELLLRKAINYKHDFPAAWMNLGIVLANTKRYNESEIAYRMALKYRKNYPDCLYNLGNLYLELNQTERAMECWFAAIKLSAQHNLAWTNLLALLDNTGQIERALQLIPSALASLPNSASVNFAIANIYGKKDRYEDAEMYFNKAINLFNSNVQAIHYANLGVLYHRWKKYDLALAMYENALKIDPKFTSAIKNIKSLKRHIS